MSTTSTSLYTGVITAPQQKNNVQKPVGISSSIACTSYSKTSSNNKPLQVSSVLPCNNPVVPNYQPVYQFPNQTIIQPIGTLIPTHYAYNGGTNIIHANQQSWSYPIISSKNSMPTFGYLQPFNNEAQINGQQNGSKRVADSQAKTQIKPKNEVNGNKPVVHKVGSSSPQEARSDTTKPVYNHNIYLGTKQIFPRKVGRPRKHYPAPLSVSESSSQASPKVSVTSPSSGISVSSCPNGDSEPKSTAEKSPSVNSNEPLSKRKSPDFTEPANVVDSKHQNLASTNGDDLVIENSSKRILTHKIENYVIHEFNEPFLVNRSNSGKSSPFSFVQSPISSEDSDETLSVSVSSPKDTEAPTCSTVTTSHVSSPVTTTASASVDNTEPATWNVEQVYQFVANTQGCDIYADKMKAQEVDGQALLLLNENHLISQLNFKLGPALKLLARINQLKKN